jgi:hypothetical protein
LFYRDVLLLLLLLPCVVVGFSLHRAQELLYGNDTQTIVELAAAAAVLALPVYFPFPNCKRPVILLY